MFLKRFAPAPGDPDLSLRIRLSAFYFTLMTTSAVATPYLGLWLSMQGLTPQEIGVANAMPLFSLMILNMVTGRLADLAGDWRRTIHMGTAIGCLTPLLLFVANGNYGLLIAWTLVVLPGNLIIPVTDAASVAASGRHGEAFARIRVWGTIGYMVATFAGGLVVERFGIDSFPAVVVAIALIRLSIALLLPPLHPSVDETKPVAPEERRSEIGKQLFDMTRPWFLLAVLGGALINASHMLQNSFGAIFWHAAGLTTAQIAILWVTATAAEIGMMFAFRGLVERFPARVMLLAAGLISVIRWVGLGLSPSFPVLLLLQTLHLATFGLSYLATVAFIANRVRKSAAASAQSFLSIIRQVTSVLALVAFGHVTERLGVASYHLAAGLAFIGVVAIAVSLRLMPPRLAGRLS
jgi:PPP family 3-phenylpropionic acid transporter